MGYAILVSRPKVDKLVVGLLAFLEAYSAGESSTTMQPWVVVVGRVQRPLCCLGRDDTNRPQIRNHLLTIARFQRYPAEQITFTATEARFLGRFQPLGVVQDQPEHTARGRSREPRETHGHDSTHAKLSSSDVLSTHFVALRQFSSTSQFRQHLTRPLGHLIVHQTPADIEGLLLCPVLFTCFWIPGDVVALLAREEGAELAGAVFNLAFSTGFPEFPSQHTSTLASHSPLFLVRLFQDERQQPQHG